LAWLRTSVKVACRITISKCTKRRNYRCINQNHHPRRTTQFPIPNTSILVRKKQSSASTGLHTTRSFSLNYYRLHRCA